MKISVLLIAFFATVAMYAQKTTINYGYDNAGNRITRTITISANAHRPDSVYMDSVPGNGIKIYPNPTAGVMKVEITGIKTDEDNFIYLYDLTGKMVFEQKNVQEISYIDITSQPTGAYVMRITLGKNTTSWKILKE